MKRASFALIAIVAMLSVFVVSAHGQQSRPRSRPEVIASGFAAEVTGTVKNVNERSGKLVLDTADGPVNVKFPAEAVQGIKKGDQVTVSVGLVKPPPSASPQSPPPTK
jgi:ferric-dicitrate binding protein FerR (iron transport regulator)